MEVLSQRKSAKNKNKQRNSLRGGVVSPLSLVGLWGRSTPYQRVFVRGNQHIRRDYVDGIW